MDEGRREGFLKVVFAGVDSAAVGQLTRERLIQGEYRVGLSLSATSLRIKGARSIGSPNYTRVAVANCG